MKLNSNLVHNLINVAIALISALQAFLLATGCSVLPSTGALECSQSWFPPEWAAMLVAILAVAKTMINIVRDGFAGLVKPQPPVVSLHQAQPHRPDTGDTPRF